MAEIQIIEPIVFEIEISLPDLLPTLTTPPGVGFAAPIKVKYTCPLSIHCGTDTPCGPNFTLPLALTIPLPTFQFPPTFDLPAFGFRVELPPSVFVNCPLFPEDGYDATKAAADSSGSNIEKEEVPTAEGESISIKELIESGDSKLKGSLVNQ